MSTTMPKKYSLADLYKRVKDAIFDDKSQANITKTLHILSTYLSNREQLKREDNDDIFVRNILLWISETILPDRKCVSYDDPLDELPSSSQVEALALTQKKAIYGLNAYETLFSISSLNDSLDTAILISLIAFTNPLDPWTTPPILTLATSILSHHKLQLTSPEFISAHLLRNFIRPLFLKSKKLETITTAGRKAMPNSAPSQRYNPDEHDQKNQPWRYETIYAITILGWIIENISPKELSTTSLPLILPPLLHLLDTPSVPLRHRALLLLPPFFHALTPPTLLATTGLGSVFSDAIFPILVSVPSITPVLEAELLLPPAYTAIFTLVETWFLIPSPSTSSSSSTTNKVSSHQEILNQRKKIETERITFLTQILREGIVTAHTYTYPSHPSLTLILLKQLQILIPKLGIHSVKHLNEIIPLSTSILLDPFAMAKPELVVEALGVLRGVLMICWVRIAGEETGRWRGEILRGVVGVWVCVCECEGGEVEGVRREIGVVGRMLVAVVKTGDEGVWEGFRGDIEKLVEVDEEIKEVFGWDR